MVDTNRFPADTGVDHPPAGRRTTVYAPVRSELAPDSGGGHAVGKRAASV